ncbi:hypothetical protein [Amycolatopsis viridis]|uniref:IrrE N-terminal-like domain-containing protein n=1 Tax=Amycolatopsis viridis TaxID=185678 RepID=A0ABX0SSB8_9PSEU|nr:hypothetical protein [Amycolatopsis viridis]NIH79862.1 hypothetical protein [Amycolatopsis viridis]
MMTRRGLRRCQALVAELPLPAPFSVPALVDALARRRGRPIHVRALPPGPGTGACGAWIRLASADVIYVEDRTSRVHRDHIVLHEIGHLLCDHPGDGAHPLARVLPDLSPELIQRLLARTGYTTEDEQEAELVASLIRTAARARASWTTTGALAEFETALGLRGT